MKDFFKKNLVMTIVFGASLILFMLYSLLRIKGVFNTIDLNISKCVCAARPSSNSFMYAVFGDFLANTYVLFGFLAILVMSFVIIGKRRGLLQACLVIMAFGISAVAVIVLKKIKYIDRPFLVNGYPYWIDGSKDSTYPSTHMAIASALSLMGGYFFFKYNINKKAKIAVIVILSIMPILFFASRLICNVHFVSDLICGLFFGVAVSAFLVVLYEFAISLLEKKFNI